MKTTIDDDNDDDDESTTTRFHDDEMTIWSLFHWFFLVVTDLRSDGRTDGHTVMTTMTTTTRRRWRRWRRRWRRWQYQLWWRPRRSLMAIRSEFPSFLLVVTDGLTDLRTYGPTDLRTDKAAYRDARTHLKTKFWPISHSFRLLLLLFN